MATIEATNLGAIEHFKSEVPENGGILLLKGPSGCGKSTLIKGLSGTLGGENKLSVRDGATHGELNALGVKVLFGGRTSRFGELEAVGLEGRYDLGVLVDPFLKDPKAADAKRIKALIQIAGVKADPALFHDLVGGAERFAELIPADVYETDDIVDMARKIELRLQKLAREKEDAGNIEVGHVAAKREAASKADLTVESDEQTLQAALLAAVRRQSALEEQARNASERAAEVQRARDALSDAEAEHTGPTVAEAQERVRVAGKRREDAALLVRAAEEELAKCRRQAEAARSEEMTAVELLTAAERHAQSLAAWRKTVEEAGPSEQISPEALQQARSDVQEAQKAIQAGSAARQARRELADAEEHSRKAAALKTEAEKLRRAAADTDQVLSDLVAKTGSPMWVKSQRLLINTEARGETFFADLSDGERTRVAVDVAIDAFPPGGAGMPVIPLPQRIFQDLQPSVRRELAEHARSRRVVVVSAQVTDDAEMCAEVL